MTTFIFHFGPFKTENEYETLLLIFFFLLLQFLFTQRDMRLLHYLWNMRIYFAKTMKMIEQEKQIE